MDQDPTQESSGGSSQGPERSEPARSRWTPKPEQILILESIFNSGMVNPTKDETARIRKLLQKFGAVGDANVFYWFQNRRSRSRRRQRQIQAGLTIEANAGAVPNPAGATGEYCYGATGSANGLPPVASDGVLVPAPSPPSSYFAASSSSGIGTNNGDTDPFSASQQMGLPEIERYPPENSSVMWPCDYANLHYQSGLITVFINGVPSEVPRGPIDLRTMFGHDVILVHASGEPVPVNEFGISLQSLQLGESYFLVSRLT